jgi:hypothetical protein
MAGMPAAAVILIGTIMTIAYHNVITLGEVIIIGLTLITLIPVGVAAVIWYREKRRPFPMKFLVDGQERRTLRLGKGRHGIRVQLNARVPTEIGTVDVRFVEWSWKGWRWMDAPISSIGVHDIPSIEWGQFGGKYPPNNKVPSIDGGIRFGANCLWNAGHFLYVDIEIDAHMPWSGYLSFDITAGHRFRTRLRMTVLEDSYAPSSY